MPVFQVSFPDYYVPEIAGLTRKRNLKSAPELAMFVSHRMESRTEADATLQRVEPLRRNRGHYE